MLQNAVLCGNGLTYLPSTSDTVLGVKVDCLAEWFSSTGSFTILVRDSVTIASASTKIENYATTVFYHGPNEKHLDTFPNDKFLTF